MTSEQSHTGRYVFSVVIPTYNRPTQLAACLASVAKLDYPRDRFEVIVVDDGSKNSPRTTVDEFRGKLNLSLLTQPNSGPAAARNAGATVAKGEFLAFTDDDCRPAPNWLETFASLLAERPNHMIGGRVINALPANIFSVSSQVMTDAVYAYYNGGGRPHFFASNNLVVPADRFRDLGGFDTSFPSAAAEDRELCERWLKQGYQMTYAPGAIVEHAHALTLLTFWKQHFGYGRGACRFHQVCQQRGWEPIQVDTNFYVHLFSYPLRHVSAPKLLLVEALLLMSHFATGAGFYWESAKRGHCT